MNASTNTAPSGTFFLLVLVTVAGGILAMVAMFSMPLVECGPLSMKATDFGDDLKVRAFDLCGKFGGRQEPASGLWVSFLGAAMVFGGGVGAAISRPKSEGAPPRIAISTTPLMTSTAESERAVLQVAAPSLLRPPDLQPPDPQLASARTPAPVVERTQPFTYSAPSISERLLTARPASFGRRAFGFVVDLVAVLVLGLVPGLIIQAAFGEEGQQNDALGGVYIGILFATFIFYEWLSSLTTGTLGMRAFGMRIVPVGERPLTATTALVRAIVLCGGGAILVGPFSGLWHPEGRTWHDLASGTGVVSL